MFSDVVNFNLSLPPSAGEIWYALALFMFASLVYFKKKNDQEENMEEASFEGSDDDDDVSWKSASDDEDDSEMMLEADAKYAEELQVQEALLASNIHNDNSNTSQEVCEICVERKEYWQMLRISNCSHSFCDDCTAKHATTKMQEKNKAIACPGINCKSKLDFNALRRIISKETFIKWDEFLCESIVLESNHLYCPFTDCSVLLINDDTNNHITKVDCPVCRRPFCAACKVPWHSEFSCKEFRKLRVGKKEDEMVVALAKKKKWKKCSNCNFFVEKVKGCAHITCRCKYEFCYDCGVKWSSTHGGCRLRG